MKKQQLVSYTGKIRAQRTLPKGPKPTKIRIYI